MNKIIFSLISLPIFLVPLFIGVQPARANEFVFEAETNSNSTCTNNTDSYDNTSNSSNRSNRFNPTCQRIKKEHYQYTQTDANGNSPYNDLVSDFSEEESNASVALFGCDCPVCINALRQLRGLSSTNNS
jgi:hypothetical protein